MGIYMVLLILLKEFCILAGLYLLGEFISSSLGLFVPGNLVGMLLLTLLLFSGFLKVNQIERMADYLLKHLILLFVPAGVGIMVYADSLSGDAAKIIFIVLLSTVLVIGLTGRIVDLVIFRLEKITKREGYQDE
jgi:holin-like protein